MEPVAAAGIRLTVHLPQGAAPALGAVLDLGADDHVLLQEA